MKKAATFVMIISLAVVMVSAGVILYNNAQDAAGANVFTELSAQLDEMISAKAEQATASPVPQDTAAPADTAAAGESPAPENLPRTLSETDDPVLLSLREQAETQPDLAGWLTIDGTVIDYPVMRSPEEAEKYLHRSYDGSYSRAGTPFMLPISDPSVPNNNIIIYAHHMKDGSMFGQLPQYETREGWEAQPIVQFDTLYERGTYRIIAVFRTSIGAEDEFPYYEYEWLDDEATFDRYMRGVMANRLYDTGETAEYGDMLLSLSTCDYHEPDGRLVVVAKKIMETEENGGV